MTAREEDYNRDAIFNERIKVLRDKGYRGFKITQQKRKWDGLLIKAENDSQITISAHGETDEEALKKLIDQIDEILEQQKS
ncbi:MAG: hypothetical protein ACQETE_14250 [Bacteroidota bacterium]